MIPQKRKYFGIIVHFGPEKVTKKALKSIYSGQRIPDVVVVVDHAKTPISLNSAGVEVYRPQKNKGYAAGINAGVAYIQKKYKPLESDVLVCMNNDIEVKPDTFKALEECIQHKSGVVTSRIGELNLITGRAHLRSSSVQFPWIVPYVHGAFFAASYGIMRRFPMPETYFMYWEDVAWSLVLIDAGISLRSCVDIQNVHNDEEGHVKDGQLYYLVRNGALVLERDTHPLWRMYWKLRNKARRVYHCVLKKRHTPPTVCRALKDARLRKEGP